MRVTRYGNLSGWAGTNRTIKAMEDLVREGRADQTVIFAASQVLRNVDPKDYPGQVSALHEWVKRNIHYVKDPNGVELVRSPFWTLYYKTGDCDDQAVLLSAMAQAVGFRTRFKAIKGDPAHPDEFSHVYSQVNIPGKGWITSDTIVPRAKLGWESDGRFGAHTWEGLGMLGADPITINLTDTPSGQAKEVPWWQTIGKAVGGALTSAATAAIDVAGKNLISGIQNKYGPFVPAVTAPVVTTTTRASVLPGASAIGPIALAAAAGLGVLLVMKKKKGR